VNGLVCLVGPPGVGKSVVSRGLADRYGVEVFRVREFAARVRVLDPASRGVLAVPNPLGWYGDVAVGYCLRRAFLRGWVSACGLVVLEDLPVSVEQMGQVSAVACLRQVPLVVVELTAPDRVLQQRAAATGAGTPAVFVARSARYRRRIGGIRQAAVVRARPYHRVDASGGVDECVQRVWAACGPRLAAGPPEEAQW